MFKKKTTVKKNGKVVAEGSKKIAKKGKKVFYSAGMKAK